MAALSQAQKRGIFARVRVVAYEHGAITAASQIDGNLMGPRDAETWAELLGYKPDPWHSHYMFCRGYNEAHWGLGPAGLRRAAHDAIDTLLGRLEAAGVDYIGAQPRLISATKVR